MDETYVKMCDCPEIQDNAPLVPGARIWFPTRGTVPSGIEVFGENDVGPGGSDGWNKNELKEEGCLILPRQEDIQAMLSELWETYFELLGAFNNWVEKCPLGGKGWVYESISELWLAFYMRQHNKTWTEKGWKDEAA